MDWRSKTPKRQVAGSNPAEPSIFFLIFNHLEVLPASVRLAMESNRGRIAMSFDDHLMTSSPLRRIYRNGREGEIDASNLHHLRPRQAQGD